MKPGKPEQQTYQVWHDKEWFRSRGTEAAFPRDYEHVANVKATSALHAVELTTDVNHDLLAPRPLVREVGFLDRDTSRGDVIVTPSGQPYRFEGDHFKEVVPVERTEREPLKEFDEILKQATDRAMFRMDGRSQEPER